MASSNATKAAPSFFNRPKLWTVVGGSEKGILVREGQSLKSAECGERLLNGSVVEELKLAKDKDRLHYRLVSGSGPAEGWVTTVANGVTLCSNMDPRAHDLDRNISSSGEESLEQSLARNRAPEAHRRLLHTADNTPPNGARPAGSEEEVLKAISRKEKGRQFRLDREAQKRKTAQPVDPVRASLMPVKEIKERLLALNVDYRGCVEKHDLDSLLVRAEAEAETDAQLGPWTCAGCGAPYRGNHERCQECRAAPRSCAAKKRTANEATDVTGTPISSFQEAGDDEDEEEARWKEVEVSAARPASDQGDSIQSVESEPGSDEGEDMLNAFFNSSEGRSALAEESVLEVPEVRRIAAQKLPDAGAAIEEPDIANLQAMSLTKPGGERRTAASPAEAPKIEAVEAAEGEEKVKLKVEVEQVHVEPDAEPEGEEERGRQDMPTNVAPEISPAIATALGDVVEKLANGYRDFLRVHDKMWQEKLQELRRLPSGSLADPELKVMAQAGCTAYLPALLHITDRRRREGGSSDADARVAAAPKEEHPNTVGQSAATNLGNVAPQEDAKQVAPEANAALQVPSFEELLAQIDAEGAREQRSQAKEDEEEERFKERRRRLEEEERELEREENAFEAAPRGEDKEKKVETMVPEEKHEEELAEDLAEEVATAEDKAEDKDTDAELSQLEAVRQETQRMLEAAERAIMEVGEREKKAKRQARQAASAVADLKANLERERLLREAAEKLASEQASAIAALRAAIESENAMHVNVAVDAQKRALRQVEEHTSDINTEASLPKAKASASSEVADDNAEAEEEEEDEDEEAHEKHTQDAEPIRQRSAARSSTSSHETPKKQAPKPEVEPTFIDECVARMVPEHTSADAIKRVKEVVKIFVTNYGCLLQASDTKAQLVKDISKLSEGQVPSGARPFKMPFVSKEWDDLVTLDPIHIEFKPEISFRKAKEDLHVQTERANKLIEVQVESSKIANCQEMINHQKFAQKILETVRVASQAVGSGNQTGPDGAADKDIQKVNTASVNKAYRDICKWVVQEHRAAASNTREEDKKPKRRKDDLVKLEAQSSAHIKL